MKRGYKTILTGELVRHYYEFAFISSSSLHPPDCPSGESGCSPVILTDACGGLAVNIYTQPYQRLLSDHFQPPLLLLFIWILNHGGVIKVGQKSNVLPWQERHYPPAKSLFFFFFFTPLLADCDPPGRTPGGMPPQGIPRRQALGRRSASTSKSRDSA